MKNKSLDLFNVSMEIDELHRLPDGAVTFKEANKTRLKYHITSNDKYYYQYHRNNGVSKIGVKLTDSTMYLQRTIEGLIWFSEILNRAYIQKVRPELFIVTGINYFPMKLNQDARVERLVHFIAAGVFPTCMSLLMPMFVYSIVYDKQERMLEIMKMNGMKMRYYWLINFLFDYLIHWVVVGFFFFVGGVILSVTVFLSTSFFLQFLMFAVWGLAEIGMAFFISPFVSQAQGATSIFLLIS